MPYGMRKKGSKTQVYNKESGKVYGSHSSKEKAKKQLAALHIHTNESSRAPRMTEVFQIIETDVVTDPEFRQALSQQKQGLAGTTGVPLPGAKVKQILTKGAQAVDPSKTYTRKGDVLASKDDAQQDIDKLAGIGGNLSADKKKGNTDSAVNIFSPLSPGK